MLKKNYPLHNHTTWRIGGVAKYFYEPTNQNELADFLARWDEQNITFLGAGSNVLIRDGGISHLVISARRLNNFTMMHGNIFYADAGVLLPILIKNAVDLRMYDAAFFAGIPGTVGGALRMNAGAFDHAIWHYVKKVKVINNRGEIFERFPSDFHCKYREVSGLDFAREWFLGAYLEFPVNHDLHARDHYQEILTARAKKQPVGEPNAGSVFKNPPGDYAARLIESLGLKGYRIGGAEVSKKHANIIINKENAKASDVENLILYIQNRIFSDYQIRLIPEVHIIGDNSCHPERSEGSSYYFTH